MRADEHGVGGGVLVAVAAVAAGALDVDHAHVTLRHRQHGGELPAKIVRRLACRPAREGAVLDLGDRARRPDRAMRVHREVVRRRQPPRRARERLLDVADVAGDVILDDGRVANVLPESALVR
jgi:hypothetical protein